MDLRKDVKMEKCEICGNEFSESDLYDIDGEKTVCWDCAEAEAVKAHEEDRDISICDYKNSCNDYALCTWCKRLFPTSELREEIDMGYLCDWCIEGIWSHGETLYLKYR